jgi:hypothetical protein
MKNAYVTIGGKWFQTIPASNGLFSTTVDLSVAAKGRLVVDLFAWGAEPGNHNYKIAHPRRIRPQHN